ncbi:dolichyl-phosphate-mannose--protein mannosyltransferase [Kitasatospora kifunensis]|uniref:Polyprenol-phosphate-mannose--protein mannosyltransferase n=1 Tax=Kitasatospora kifunensis TaxID=58351 RepID=A0A7W7R054_KITKI|nr:phospholipid carrier-dependent glycosyltransferase [Kitasatospora kifunensis]MBB4923027.1 dolichyl-phosphate-mannose--protein O-mannosyl transferase [Kitasatospora kifunensis]
MADTAVTERPAAQAPPARPSVLLELRRRTLWLSRYAGWLGPIAVALFAGVLRLWNLGSPNAFVFDETYYPKDAWSLFQQGYEGVWPASANDQILAHPQVIPLTSAPAFIAHPPLGKWVIALGEAAFGLHPFGWRVMVALLGTLSVLMLARIGRRLFGSTLIGCTAALLMSVDGLQFVMSRTGLLDGLLMFFVLAAFGALLIDRDRVRARLAEPGVDGDRVNLGLRPWRLAAGLLLGAACSVKWNGAQILAAFGLLTVLWDQAGRRAAGARFPLRSMLRRDAAPAFGSLVVVGALTYLASWSGWFATSGGYDRQWADGRPGLLPAPLRSWWHYQSEMWHFNTTLTTPHTYQSNPWSWLVQGRPVSMYWQPVPTGQQGCTSSGGCTTQILALGTPLLWWTACFALAYVLYRWFFRRDWRSGAVLCAVAATYLPWFEFQQRTIFSFYMVVLVPFLCLAVAQMLGAMVGPAGSTPTRRAVGSLAAGGIVLAVMGCFLYFLPLYTAEVIPMSVWQDHMWFTSWI